MTGLDMLYWRAPAWLVLSLLPLAAVLVAGLMQRRAWRRLADTRLLPWLQVRSGQSTARLQRLLLLLSWLLLCVALAGPRTPAWVPPQLQPQERQLIALVDLSASMRVRDGQPDRLGSALRLLQGLAAQAPPQLRIGLVIYAGKAYRLLPPSDDRRLLAHYLQQLPAMQPPTLGNDLADALALAAGMPGEAHDRQLLVLSDGDLGEQAVAAATAAAHTIAGDMPIHFIGLGTDEHGAVPRSNGEPMILDGRRISSRRHAGWMQSLAGQPGIHYHAVEVLDDEQLARIVRSAPPRIPAAASERVLWHEHFALPLLIGMALLLIALQLGQGAGRRSLLALLGGLLLGGCQGPADDDPEHTMRAALQQQDYAKVRTLAAVLKGYPARYAEGIACYRLDEQACAVQAFAQAAWQAPDELARGRAAFNLGLAHFRLGDYEQAAVLFRDAELHGVDAAICRLNLSYAQSLAAGVRKWLEDIAETERRADWRSAAGRFPEGFEDQLAEGIKLMRPPQSVEGLPQLVGEQVQALLAKGAAFRFGRQAQAASGEQRSWVESPQQDAPGDTAQLMNALMSIEAGLPMRPAEPLQVQGQRPW